MPKRTTAFDLPLPLSDAETPAYRQLYQALRSEILDGRLGPGARLPATRDLARQYQLSRGTIVNAFELLKSEGYLDGSIGSGTYVSKVLPDDLLHVERDGRRAGDRQPSVQPKPRRRMSGYAKRVRLFPFRTAPGRARSAPTYRRWICFPPGFGRSLPLAAGGRSPLIFSGVAIPWDIVRSRSRGRLPAYFARSALLARTGGDRIRRAGSARSGGSHLPESGRSRMHGESGIYRRGHGI